MSLLNLPGLEMDAARTVETPQSMTIGVKRRPNGLDHCPHCGSVKVAANGTRRVTYADLPIRGKPTFLDWDRQRFICRDCGKTASDEHPELHSQFLMTMRLYDWIGDRSLRNTFASVAADVGLDERSVRRVFAEWSAGKMAARPFVTPKWLGIDEVHLLKRPRGVLTNIDERTLVDLLPDRSQKAMALRISQFNLAKIELVTMDMWRPYRKVVEDLIPHAHIVVDKWHVLRMANDAMEKIRKGFRADLPPARRRRLMHDRWLLAKRDRDLRPDERLILEAWINEFKPLGEAWKAKEGFYNIYEANDAPRHARAAYAHWQRYLDGNVRKAFQPLLTAVANWDGPIFNYFDYRVTNAYTEAMNRLIADSNRLGRGYSFDVLRTRMLLARGALKQEGLPAGTFGFREDGEQPFTGVHIPTLTRLIENGQW